MFQNLIIREVQEGQILRVRDTLSTILFYTHIPRTPVPLAEGLTAGDFVRYTGRQMCTGAHEWAYPRPTHFCSKHHTPEELGDWLGKLGGYLGASEIHVLLWPRKVMQAGGKVSVGSSEAMVAFTYDERSAKQLSLMRKDVPPAIIADS